MTKTTITSLCDRLDRINCICHNDESDALKLKLIDGLSGGFMPMSKSSGEEASYADVVAERDGLAELYGTTFDKLKTAEWRLWLLADWKFFIFFPMSAIVAGLICAAVIIHFVRR